MPPVVNGYYVLRVCSLLFSNDEYMATSYGDSLSFSHFGKNIFSDICGLRFPSFDFNVLYDTLTNNISLQELVIYDHKQKPNLFPLQKKTIGVYNAPYFHHRVTRRFSVPTRWLRNTHWHNVSQTKADDLRRRPRWKTLLTPVLEKSCSRQNLVFSRNHR